MFVVRTILDKTDIANDQLADGQLNQFTATTKHGERVIGVDLLLQAAELALLLPVVDRRHHDNDDDRTQYSNAVDPAVLLGLLVSRMSCKRVSHTSGGSIIWEATTAKRNYYKTN